MPSRYLVVKDDIPGHHLNTIPVEGTEHFKTVPQGFEYEVPLSLNAEVCVSEFRAKAKGNKPGARESQNNIKNVQIANMVAEFNDTSDFLYSAYSEAQKGKKFVKKIRRMKSQSPPRPGKTSPGRHRSPLRNRVGGSGAQGSTMLSNVAGKEGETNQASSEAIPKAIMINTTEESKSVTTGAAAGATTNASSTTNLESSSNLDVPQPRKNSILNRA